jgi:peptide/nickel transport system substrate-binding protein
MEQDPPLVLVGMGEYPRCLVQLREGTNPKDYFGIYDVVRFDTFWLDKA